MGSELSGLGLQDGTNMMTEETSRPRQATVTRGRYVTMSQAESHSRTSSAALSLGSEQALAPALASQRTFARRGL